MRVGGKLEGVASLSVGVAINNKSTGVCILKSYIFRFDIIILRLKMSYPPYPPGPGGYPPQAPSGYPSPPGGPTPYPPGAPSNTVSCENVYNINFSD